MLLNGDVGDTIRLLRNAAYPTTVVIKGIDILAIDEAQQIMTW
jgi:hypothetical protein